MRYICLSCNNIFFEEGDNAWHPCPDCGGDSWWEDSGYVKGNYSTPYDPPWRKFETEMRTGSPNEQFEAAENFSKMRDETTKKDLKADRWERSRKDWFYKQKNKWVKKGRKI